MYAQNDIVLTLFLSLSVCLSVCLSVSVSSAGNVSEQIDISSYISDFLVLLQYFILLFSYFF